MIGLYLDLQGGTVAEGVAQRFTSSLSAGLVKPVGHQRLGRALLATHCETLAAARRWRAAAVPGGGALLFTGYIDDARALQSTLGIASSDPAELYAAGFARWGDAVDLRATGQFATILVFPEARRVRCTRSPLHAPPLHVWSDRERVIVASLARLLFSTGEIAAEIDEQKIADSLYLNYADAERGWYKGVTRVRTGHRLILGGGKVGSHRYYDIAALPRVRLKRDSDYVDAASALLAEGTRAALTGFTRPSVSVSGGFDSQAVSAFALEARGADCPLLGLTAVPEPGWMGEDAPGRFGDERHHVGALAALYPALEIETVDAAGLSFDHRLDAMFLMGGIAPRNAMNLHWVHAIRARAKARGCDVVLLGAMGNLSFSFSGAGALPSWFARGHWGRLARELRAGRKDRSLGRAFLSDALRPFMPEPPQRLWMRKRAMAATHPLGSWSPLNAGYAARLRVRERAMDMRQDASFHAARSTRAYRALTIENAMTEMGEIRQGLELIHGIPARDPTAYRPLVEFCMGIPDDQYLRNGEARWLARRMLRGRVPDMVLNETRRGRQAVDWPLRLGREREALAGELDVLAADAAMAERLDLPRLRAALDRWSPGAPTDADTAAVLELALPRAIATARFIRFVEGTNG